MKSLSFVCLLFLSATFFGQSNPAVGNPQSLASPVFSRTPQGLPNARTGLSPARGALPQNSGLSFAQPVLYGTAGFDPLSILVADVNRDGKPDLVMAQCQGTNNCGFGVGQVAVLLGNGDGTFQTAVTYATGSYYSVSVAAADVNGDGKLDLVVTDACQSSVCGDNGAVSVLLGNGDGTFQAGVSYDAGGTSTDSVAVADVNGDGKPDIVIANLCATSVCTNDGSVGVLLGNGDGSFRSVVTYDSGGSRSSSVAVEDVNGDGKPDVVVANTCLAGSDCGAGTVAVLLGNGDGTFQTAVTYATGGYYPVSVVIADLNADGKPDLVVANNEGSSTDCNDGPVGVLLGNGDGTFRTAVAYGPGGCDTSYATAADVNGDGKLDLVVTTDAYINGCCDGTVEVFLGNGDGTFTLASSNDSGGMVGSSGAVADVNGDGKPDLLVTNSSGTVGVLLNISSYPTTTVLTSSLNPSSLGQTVTFTATVTPQYEFGKSTPSGSVNFFDGKTGLGHAALNVSGIAILSTSTLAVGTHSITARYNAGPNFLSSTSQVLSQVVQGAIVQLSPPSVNFGNWTIGGQTKQGVLIDLTNTGNIALTISSMGITGADSADFVQEGICPSSLAAGGSCTVTVSFTPTVLGTRTAALSITDNAPNSPQSVPLTGVGVLPAVTLTPTSLTFPTQIVFTNSKTQAVTLDNTGLGILSISEVAVTGPFTQTNNCGSTVAAGRNCTLTVTFRPTTAGPITGTLSITDNASLSPQTVSLQGTGTYVEFNPTAFNFGNQPVGTKSLPKKITLSNKGTVPLSITKISVIGTNAADFTQANTCGTGIAAGESCFITVTFTPSAEGARSASISVTDNGGASPQSVGLSGTGT
jgi:hypothetical protein